MALDLPGLARPLMGLDAQKVSRSHMFTTFWITRDRYDNPLSYSLWSVEPTRDRDGHWARLDPKRTSTDVRQICSAKVGEAIVGRPLALGEKIGPILGVYSPRQESTTQTTQKTQ